MIGGGNQPQNHEHYDLQLPVRRDKPARRRRWKSSTPKG
jgi:hypothetical protein